MVALAFLAVAPGAGAHLRSGTIAVDYRAGTVAPETSAYAAVIYQSDRGLQLTLKPGHMVTVLGYLGEPMFRLDAHGLWTNAASPSAAVAGLLARALRVDARTPRWRLQGGRGSAVWHDARVQTLPAGVERAAWSVPLIVDGRRARLDGYLRRFPAPSLWPWLGLLACLLGIGTAAIMPRRRELLRIGARVCAFGAIAASVVIPLAFSLDSYASPGTWIEAGNEIVFLGIGLGVLLRGPENFQAGAAIGSGLVAVAVGLSKGATFLHPIVLAILPGTLTRFLAVTAIGAGLNAAILGCLCYSEPATPTGEIQLSEWSAADPLGG